MIRKLKKTDIEGLNKLPPIDWNFDYELFLDDFLRDDFFHAFVLIQHEKIVGTGNVLIKNNIGWLANIIVNGEYRGKGLGYKMTKFLVEFLEDNHCETKLLIATELGKPVYQKLGFREVTEYLCFDSVADTKYTVPNAVRELTNSDLESVYKLDREANGENRKHLIDKFYNHGLGYFSDNDELLGCFLPNFGRGLILSRHSQAGIELLRIKHSKKGKRTLLPVENQNAIDALIMSGFKRGNKCSKMILGKENTWNPEYIYSYGSGYCG